VAIIGIEVVDAALIAVRDGAVAAPSPGVALLDPAGLRVGTPAAAAARLQPVLASDRVWSDLSTESLAQRDPPLSHADLAHAHLSSWWQEIAEEGDSAVFAVPGSMRLHQVGLLLGIARRVGIPVAGVVDAAVAACADLQARATVKHLDLQFHQSVLTEMRKTLPCCPGHGTLGPRASPPSHLLAPSIHSFPPKNGSPYASET
jgi:hypothetical protein